MIPAVIGYCLAYVAFALAVVSLVRQSLSPKAVADYLVPDAPVRDDTQWYKVDVPGVCLYVCGSFAAALTAQSAGCTFRRATPEEVEEVRRAPSTASWSADGLSSRSSASPRFSGPGL